MVNKSPILEFDPTREALIEPSKVNPKYDAPEHCVICFFREVIEKVITTHKARVVADNRWEDGMHTLYEIAFQDQRLGFYHPGVGAPIASALLEEVIAFGCKKIHRLWGRRRLGEGHPCGRSGSFDWSCKR
jgi:uridine phosphorylase